MLRKSPHPREHPAEKRLKFMVEIRNHSFEILREGSSLYVSLFTLLVQALPALLAVAVPLRYHGNSAGAARHTSDAGASLLQTGTQSHTS